MKYSQRSTEDYSGHSAPKSPRHGIGISLRPYLNSTQSSEMTLANAGSPTKTLIPCFRERQFSKELHLSGREPRQGGLDSLPSRTLHLRALWRWRFGDTRCSQVRQIFQILFSHRSQYNVSPLRTVSEFLYVHHECPHFTYSQHTCGWMSTFVPKLSKPVTLYPIARCLLYATLEITQLSSCYTVLNFLDCPFTSFIATSSFFFWTPDPTPSSWLFPMTLFPALFMFFVWLIVH